MSKSKKRPTVVTYKTGKLLVGSCLDRLKMLPDQSVAAIVTDPPYELGFMGKSWDASGIAYSVELWTECLRVLKPGGHLLAFGGTRTYHRMACAIEDAGFEIRDSLHWIYGSGFPKNLDVSKAIDKQRHARADVYRVTAWIRETRDAAGKTNKDIDEAFGFSGMAGHWTSSKSQPAVPTIEQIPELLDLLGLGLDDVPNEMRKLLWDLNGKRGEPGKNWAKRPKVGKGKSTLIAADGRYAVTNGEAEKKWEPKSYDVTAPASEEAKRWTGWGTAIKPAHEPIVLARKPFPGTVASNVLAHETGAINVDGCRIGTESRYNQPPGTGSDHVQQLKPGGGGNWVTGRWPANVIFDEAAGAELGEVARFFYCPKPGKSERDAGLDTLDKHDTPGVDAGRVDGTLDGKVTAPRQNFHPTVKPVELMRWLVRLITPPGGVVLDPFLGSGTTAVAAIAEGFEWVGCEMTEDYLPIIAGRVKHAQKQHPWHS